MSKYLDLAKKIKALAEKGSPGERENAARALKSMMLKYGITESQLDDEIEDYRAIKVGINKYHHRLLEQICYMVFNIPDFPIYRVNSERGTRYLFTTISKHIEIECMFEFYKARFDEQLSLYYDAFVMKNDLYPEGSAKPESFFSEAEIEKMRKAAAIASGLETSEYRKQLNAG